jgi:hypothetical protein
MIEKGLFRRLILLCISNQKLYGNPSITRVSNITIAAGSSNVVLQDLYPVGTITPSLRRYF